MREIHLMFEGNRDSERKVADLIQEAIFKVLNQERMDVKSFLNQPREENQKLMIGTPRQLATELEIPGFLKKQP